MELDKGVIMVMKDKDLTERNVNMLYEKQGLNGGRQSLQRLGLQYGDGLSLAIDLKGGTDCAV